MSILFVLFALECGSVRLGRAVIGGLMVATLYTLFFVPVTYSLLRHKPPKDFDSEEAT